MAIFLALTAAFSLYVYAEKQIDRANSQRQNSYRLADQLRQSSDELTRMARTYVVTGDPRDKQYYQDILDIRDGKKPRPEGYFEVYWDMVLADGIAPPVADKGRPIPLLELMHQEGFTDEEMSKLTEAKAKSDILSELEFKAMKMVESADTDRHVNHATAEKMLHDQNYHRAKAEVMRPINEFYAMMNKRTAEAVSRTENIALAFRLVFIAATLVATLMLWRAYRVLHATLGGSADEIRSYLINIGYGNLSDTITVPPGAEDSMLAGLSDMQKKLYAHEIERKQAADQLRIAAAAFQSQEGIVVTDASDVILRVNRAFSDMTGYTAEEAIGKKMNFLKSNRHDDDFYSTMWLSILRDGVWQGEVWNQVKSGDARLHRLTITAVRGHDDAITNYVGTYTDITEYKQAEDQLRIAATAFETHEAIMITDADSRIIRVNHAFEKITGYSAIEAIGKNPRMLSSGRHDIDFYESMWHELLRAGTWSGELWDRHKSGTIYPKQATITAVKNAAGETTQYVAIFTDISERKKTEEEIHNLAFNDALTGLPNRRLLLDRLGLALSVSARSQQYGALLFLDLDKFKTLNDTLGHDYGDQLLVEVGNRLKFCVREVDTVARLGGDEFVVLIEDISADAEDASQSVAQIAEKIRAVLATPYAVNGHELYSSPSIGVCLFCGSNASVDELIKRADMAMYQAKDAGRNRVRFFDPQMQHSVETRAALESDLRQAIAQQQLHLYYQVQLGQDQRPVGAEALIRWIHPQRGMVSPAQFIPVAEDSTLILEIGHWVLDTACQQIARWEQNEKTRHLVLAVNISAQQFKQPDFVDQVAAVIQKNGIEPSRLKLELTESVALDDLDTVVAKMHALRQSLRVTLSLDDFGTGYSSLSYLKQLPLDQLKIDQSFVRDMTEDSSDAVMVKTIIDMAHNFDLSVIAEGVETEVQQALLKQLGCLTYQGYLFSKPVPLPEFEALLKTKFS